MASKYDRLGDHLAAIGAATIIFTFAEVEAVVGPLPRDARLFNGSWWGAAPRASYHHAHTLHWQRAGYMADPPDFAAETVTFRRVGP
jgi:hypothetical protein